MNTELISGALGSDADTTSLNGDKLNVSVLKAALPT